MEQIKYGIIHTHTENSLKDSVLSPSKLCKRAAELGAPAVVLTDHGVLTGVYEFMREAQACGIKGIPGVEAYVQEDDSLSKRNHLILIPKNYTGYKAISKAVTLSNTRIMDGRPCMNLEILKQCFGSAGIGHGNVIATSACVGGVLSQILLSNRNLTAEATKIQEKMKKYNNPEDPAYIANKKRLDDLDGEIKQLMKERDTVRKIAERKFKQKERALNALTPGSEEHTRAYERLEQERQESEQAQVQLTNIKKNIANLNKTKKAISAQCKEAEKTHPQWMIQKKNLDKISENMRTDEELYDDAKNMAKAYLGIFGDSNFYVELQYHRIQDEAYVMPVLAKLAEEMSLPVVACNDVHYANNTQNDIRARQIVSSLRFNRWLPLREGDTEYYIKTDKELSDILSEILSEETVKKALNGIADIISCCNVELPKATHYPKYIGNETAKDRLRRLANEGIANRYPKDEWTSAHQKRMEYELSVIEDMGFSDYLCIVEDFLSYGRKLGKENPEKVGLSIGPGRGSAAGSLVCYLVGITSIDPIKYELLFERFLNKERVSMPDIDSDFDIHIRGRVLDYVKDKYGENAVCNIVTKGTLAAKAAIRNVARVTGDEKHADTTAFMRIGDEIAKSIPGTPGIKLADVEEELKEKFKNNEDALQIIQDAKLVEGASLQYGMHAAGVIIADNGDVSEYVPLMWNEKDESWMCQCNMVEAEEYAGLLKMDFLGLRNLNIISETLRHIKRNYGISLDMEEISRKLKDGVSTPFDKQGNVFRDIFSKGQTNSVFQFESSGMKKMLTQFRPSSIEDIILLVATYRPGPMQYLDDIIAVKHKKKKPRYIIPEMESVLGPTYGYPVYQEQIQQIFNKFAGFSLGEADIIRRYMSKKKTEKFAAYKEKFIEGLIEHGADAEDAQKFWEQLLDFSLYAFNKSHACAYAFVAFYTAWLKLNYPVEYMTAVLNYSETKKLPMLISDCKKMGIRVVSPDVNKSDFEFKNQNGEIVFGIGSVKGIKNSANVVVNARKNGKFHSFKDFLERTNANKNIIEGLIYCGALDCFCPNRTAMIASFPEILEMYKKIQKESSKLEEISQTLRIAIGLDDDTGLNDTLLAEAVKQKQIKQTNASQYRRIVNRIRDYKECYAKMVLPIDYPQNKDMLLKKEKELIGAYVSGHPLDDYRDIKKTRTHAICDLESGNATISGLIEDVRYTQRKSDGKPMAFFTLEDETDSIEVCCFTRAYEENGECIFQGNVVSIKGRCIEEETITDDEDTEPILKFHAEEIRTLENQKRRILISVKNIVDWTENVYSKILQYMGSDYDVFVHDKATGEIREGDHLTVSSAILNADIPNTEISNFTEANE